MIIRTISRQHTGGATKRRDQPEWMTDGPSVVLSLISGLPVIRAQVSVAATRSKKARAR